jgi:hypothetical protein
MVTRLLLVGALMMGALTLSLPARAVDLIYACVNNSSGTIKIVGQTETCPNNSFKTSLSTVAPTPPPDPLPTDVYVSAMDPSRFESLEILQDSVTTIRTLYGLPAGKYLVIGQVALVEESFSFSPINQLECFITDSLGDSSLPMFTKTQEDVRALSGLSMSWTLAFDQPADIFLACTPSSVISVEGATAKVFGVSLVAHAVGAIVDKSQP